MTDEYVFPATTIDDLPRIDVHLDAKIEPSGMSGWNDKRKAWQIFVNREHHVHRQRFTLLHEYKHIIDFPIWRIAYPNIGTTTGHERQEAICDYFAACVLMPRPLVKRAWEDGHHDVKELSRMFGVSPAAMRYRLHQLGLTTIDRCKTTFFRHRNDPHPRLRLHRQGDYR